MSEQRFDLASAALFNLAAEISRQHAVLLLKAVPFDAVAVIPAAPLLLPAAPVAADACDSCGADDEGLSMSEYEDAGDSSVGYGPDVAVFCDSCAAGKGLIDPRVRRTRPSTREEIAADIAAVVIDGLIRDDRIIGEFTTTNYEMIAEQIEQILNQEAA